MNIIESWRDNVKEKLLSSNIFPKFINKENDLVVLATTMAEFFSILVNESRVLEDYPNNEEFLFEFLKQKTFFLDKEKNNLSSLQTILQNQITEIAKRGSIQIFEKDGEISKIIGRVVESDEFIFNPLLNEDIGWWVDKESPIYKGISKGYNNIRGYEFFKDFVDLSKYPVLGNYVIVNDSDNEGNQIQALNITGDTGTTISGINPYESQENTDPEGPLDRFSVVKNENLTSSSWKLFDILIEDTYSPSQIKVNLKIRYKANDPNENLNQVRIRIHSGGNVGPTSNYITINLTNSFQQINIPLTNSANTYTRVLFEVSTTTPPIIIPQGTIIDIKDVEVFTETNQSVNILGYETDPDNGIWNVQYNHIILGSGGGGFLKPDYLNYAIICSPKISYEVTFKIKHSGDGNIDFGCLGLDKNNNLITFSSSESSLPTAFFIQNYEPLSNSDYIFIRGILYSLEDLDVDPITNIESVEFEEGDLIYQDNEQGTDSLQYSLLGELEALGINPEIFSLENGDLLVDVDVGGIENKLNIGRGNNLVLEENVVKILPFLQIKDGNNSNSYIWDFKVRPLRGLSSRGYISPIKLLEFWFKNNNQEFVLNDKNQYPRLNYILKNFLLPYDWDLNTKTL